MRVENVRWTPAGELCGVLKVRGLRTHARPRRPLVRAAYGRPGSDDSHYPLNSCFRMTGQPATSNVTVAARSAT